MTRTSQFAMRW